jgi:uncharacterized protein YdeI (BOF family)
MASMKKFFALGIVLLALSGAVYAQSFDGGGYSGPSLETITIADLVDVYPNEYVIVYGYLEQQRTPGRFVFADGSVDEDNYVSVIARIDGPAWVNLEIDDSAPVLLYGIVLKSEYSTEILVERVGFPPEEE